MEDRAYLLVEDEAPQIMNWLKSLSELGSKDAECLSCVSWSEFLVHSKNTYSVIPETDLQMEGCEVEILHFYDGESNRTIGAKKGNVIVLTVTDPRSADHVCSWLSKNLPARCLSFLDYGLAKKLDASLAEKIAPHLACSYNQLCFGSSSRRLDMKYSELLGLTKSKAAYFIGESKRSLKHEDGSLEAVQEGIKHWNDRHKHFTGDTHVDRILSLFVRGHSDKSWDKKLDGPFGHNALASPDSTSRVEISGLLPELTDTDEDTLKALFMCEGPNQIKPRSKSIENINLKILLRFLDLRVQSLPKYWYPPFYPGILFLCQLRRLTLALSDTKNGKRMPPVLSFQKRSIEYKFSVEIYDSPLNQDYNDFVGKGMGDSFRHLAALRRGWLDWVEDTDLHNHWIGISADGKVSELFRPSILKHNMKIQIAKDDKSLLRVSWNN